MLKRQNIWVEKFPIFNCQPLCLGNAVNKEPVFIERY